MSEITTQHLRQFLAYLRETEHRFDSSCRMAQRPVNSTTIQKYYRALSCLFKWLINEEILVKNPLLKIGVPKAERKVVKALSSTRVAELIKGFDDTFEGVRNRAIILTLVDCGLRLRELLGLKLNDIDMNQQLLKVDGKTGERVVRFGTTAKQALSKYLVNRSKVNGHGATLWLIQEGTALKESSVETMFRAISKRTGIAVHPHLLRHTFATLWLRNGGDSLMLQRLLGHTTLMMTNRYCQAVGCYDAIESHELYSPADRLDFASE